MAKLAVVCVRDTKVPGFMHPQFAGSIADGIRRFAQASNDPQTMVCAHPADFELWHVGDWNNESGELEAASPKRLCGALDVKEKPAQTVLPLDGQKVSK